MTFSQCHRRSAERRIAEATGCESRHRPDPARHLLQRACLTLAASCLCVRHLFDARWLIHERWLGGAMLSLSLGRDGCVKAAAPAPRIECALLRCAAFVAVQLFFVAHTRSCTIRDAGCPPPAPCSDEKGCVKAARLHKSSKYPKNSQKLADQFCSDQCL